MKFWRILLIFLMQILFTLACSQTQRVDVYDIDRSTISGTGEVFLYAIAYNEEQLAMSLLSSNAKSEVTALCKDGEVLGCFNDFHLQEWGQVQSLGYLPNYSSDLSATYHIVWGRQRNIWVVLEMVNEDGEWRVDKWRGWIHSETIPYDVIDGSNSINQFPPDG